MGRRSMAWKLEPHFTLRDFQNDCLRKQQHVPHSLIADDMGLGKTVEAIALDRYRRIKALARDAKTLVVSPLSVVDVWVRHYAWMLPNLKVVAYDGEGKQPAKARAEFLQQVRQGDADVYVVHWEAVRLMPELTQPTWFHIIADEAHRAKNRKAQQTVAFKKLSSKHKTACTGTPAETKPDDMWSVLNWLYPKKFGSYWNFRKAFVIVENYDGYPKITGVKNVDVLLERIAPFYTRRLKEEVAKELPAKTYDEITVSLSPAQRKHYENMKNDMLTWVGEHEDQPLAAPAVIAKLRRLQQFAISSIKMVPGYRWITLDTQHLVDRWNEKIEDPSQHVQIGFKYKIEVMLAKLIEPSTKLDAIMDKILDNPTEPFVVFSQSSQAIDLLGARLAKAKIPHGVYTGNTSKRDRDQIVEEFQAGKLRVFAGTIRAGGEGITLTRASKMIFIDRDWSPSKNVQAEDRVHRIGQPNTVQIIDVVAKNTVDRGRNQQIQQTWGWLKQILGDK